MVAKTADAIRREQQRKARQAAELRANLVRRKAHKREQSVTGRPEIGSEPANAPAAKLED